MRSFALSLVAICAIALTLRTAWLGADPPVAGAVGIVWHDEGAWVHNARNRALWGAWRTDNWNPVFVAPVFTALEYASFEAFGVGTWQARVVPVVSGLVAVLALAAGLLSVAGRRAALVGALLLAVNYPFVMWNRAALMESTLAALLVTAWAAYAAGERRPGWGVVAGAAAVLAWFTKASAAFFIGALVLVSLLAFIRPSAQPDADRVTSTEDAAHRRLSTMTLAGLVVAGLLIGAVFVLPHWREYAFYNWQMSVTRKPEYTIKALVDRASWLPVVQGIFSRMPLATAAGLVGLIGIVARWRTAAASERLLVLWVGLGLAELVVHDSGNERRYVMFIPALVALASLVLTRAMTPIDRRSRQGAPPTLAGDALMAAALLPSLYLLAGTLLRPVFLTQIEAGDLKTVVRLSVAIAVVVALALWRFRGILVALIEPRVPASWLAVILMLSVGWNGIEFANWARHRRYVNYDASVAIGHLLPPGTLVHGKLANGLSLENRIRPIFVGNGFGNYEDRLRRDDVRYILTYDLPAIGFESSNGSGLIQGILDHYPNRRTLATFDVDETPAPDRAVLIDKRPAGP
jgi:hypothetical protein